MYVCVYVCVCVCVYVCVCVCVNVHVCEGSIGGLGVGSIPVANAFQLHKH